MQFRLLGPVEIETADGALVVPRRRDRCLLAILLLEANRVVPVGQLIELLWDGRPPDEPRRAIHGQVSRLRAVLATGGDDDPVTLATVGGSYRVKVDAQSVDVHRFRTLLDGATRTGDLADRVDRIRAALDLWRGPPLENAASPWLRDRLCADLEEQRLAAVEALVSASLRLRREQEILPELAGLAAAQPGGERLAALHMRALYQADRKADALAAYERVRAHLADELGLSPGPKLRELHQAILRDQVDVPVPPVAAPATVAVPEAAPGVLDPVPRQLPADVAGFTGRTAHLERLDASLPDERAASAGIIAISGTAGVGKTALAVHWGHRVADRFPDGQLYVNLRGFDPGGTPIEPAAAVRGVLDALGVPPPRIPASLDAQIGRYRSLLADRRMLLVLDNARDAEQVRPLLPGAPGCLVAVTSRDQLSGLVTVEGARPVTLDLLVPAEARELLARRLGADRVEAEPEAADEIVRRCARLPLALAVVATRAALHPHFSLASLAKELREAGSSLEAMSEPGSVADLPAVFSWSYHALRAPAARLFRLIGLHPGPDLSTAAAASLAGAAAPEARRSLAELARAHLVSEHTPGRFTLHDLLRAYARELAHQVDTGADRHAAGRRMLDHYLHTADTAAGHLDPHRFAPPLDPVAAGVTPEPVDGQEPALAWFTTEHPVLLGVVTSAAATGFDAHAWRLAGAVTEFLQRQGRWAELEAVQRTALDAARRLADPVALAFAHRGVASACLSLGRHDEAHAHLRKALEQFGRAGVRTGQSRVHLSLGGVLERQGRHQEAIAELERCLALCQDEGDAYEQALAFSGLGWLHLQLGDHRQAMGDCQRAIALLERLGNRPGQAMVWDSLGYAQHRHGDHRRAVASYRRSLGLVREGGDRYREAYVLDHLGDAHTAAGELDAGREAWQQALAILQELDVPDAGDVRAKLDR